MTPRPAIARYLPGIKLGEGGMGAVYRVIGGDDRIMAVDYTAKGATFVLHFFEELKRRIP